MKSIAKQILSVVLVFCLSLSLLPNVAMPAEAASTGLSLSQLRQKFPHGKYWNHAGNPGSSNSVNNQDGYTSTPCSQHGVVGTSKQTCNGFQPSGTQLSWQCMGYAEKLGYDATGYNPRNNANGWYTYTSSSALNNLKPGDIVRYKNDGHSIYVIGVNGDTVTYTDCNNDGHCIIRWDATISKSTLRSSFTHVRSAPSSVSPGPTSCNCSTSYAGNYVCVTSALNLNIRNGHGTSYAVVGSIPSGATVYISKATGTGSNDWGHVTYNGATGYVSMQYMQKQGENHAETPTIKWWVSDSEYGNQPGSYKVGNRYWFCYELYDSVTGKPWNEVASNKYTIKIAFYNPNGSLKYDSTYNNTDKAWISSFFDSPGTYKCSVELTGDFVFSGTRNFTVQDDPKKVHTSTTSVSLDLYGTKSKDIYVWGSGYYNGSCVYNWQRSNDKVTCSWGEWNSENKCPLTITGIAPGTSTVTVSIKDKDSGKVLHSIPIVVNIVETTKPTVSISSTNNLATSQTVTISMSDSYGIAGYYWGTNSTYSSNTYTSTSSTSATKTISSAGTYYLNVKDVAGNISNTQNITFYKTTLNANGGSVTPTSVLTKSGNSFTLPTPTRSGYTFKGWATSSTATTAAYSAGSSFKPTGNTTLYALWSYNDTTTPTVSISSTNNVASSQTVTLSLSDNVGVVSYYWGTISSPSSSSYTSITSATSKSITKTVSDSGTYYLIAKDAAGNSTKVSVTFYKTILNGNGGSVTPSSVLTKSGNSFTLPSATYTGKSFKGWATSSTATSSSYSSGSSYKPTGNTTLYAVFVANSYTLYYSANGGSNAPANQTGATSYTISSTVPTKFGYTFLGWAERSSATSATYEPEDSISLTEDTTLYAVWKSATTMSVNTSYSASVSFSNKEIYYAFTPSSSGDYIFESTGSVDSKIYVYNSSGTQLGTDDDSSDEGTNFKLQINLTAGTKYYIKVRAYSANIGNITFKAIPATYTLRYNANGGTGVPANQTGSASYTISSTIPERNGFVFLGWSKSITDTSSIYKYGDTIKLTEDTTLYAVWHKHSYVLKSTIAATCTTSGIKIYTCSECSDSYTETIAKLAHNVVTVKGKAATCTTTGLTDGTKCSECNAVITAQQTIAKLDHNYKITTTKATPTKGGNIKTACTVCGNVKTNTTIYYPKTITLSATKYTYSGTAKAPNVTVKDSKGNTLKKGTDYTVTYSSGKTKVGKYAVTITFKGNYSGTVTKYYLILPGKTSKITPTRTSTTIKAAWNAVTGASGYKVELLSSSNSVLKTVHTSNLTYKFTGLTGGTNYKIRVTAYKTIKSVKEYSLSSTTLSTSTTFATPPFTVSSTTKGKASFSWGNISGETGYQIYYSTNSSSGFTKLGTYTANTTGATKSNLTSGKTYYFKIRAYKKVGDSIIYSSWSPVQSVKIK